MIRRAFLKAAAGALAGLGWLRRSPAGLGLDSHGPTCEVCGEPATVLARDAVELEPVNGWLQFRGDGPRHCYCPAHYRPPVARRLDGRVEPTRGWATADPSLLAQYGAH